LGSALRSNLPRAVLLLAALAVVGLPRARAGEPAGAGPGAETNKKLFAALEAALGSEAEARGDCTGAAEEWLDAFAGAARTPAAEVLLLRLAEANDLDTEPRRAASVYERLLASTPPLTGRVRQMVSDRLARRYRAAGRFGRAAALEREMGYVNAWAVSGPFGYTRRSVHSQVFAPERELDLDGPMASGSRTVEWLAPGVPHSGRRTDVFAPLYPKEGCAYAVAQVESDKSLYTRLIVRCAGPFKLWWNDSLRVDADREDEAESDEIVVPIALNKGWNRLLLKMTALAPVLSCRVEDPSGLPLKGLRWERGLVLHDPVHLRFPGSPKVSVDIGSSRALSAVLKSGKLPAEREALVRAALGMVAGSEGRSEEALAEFVRATELCPERPHLWYQLARTAEVADHLPPSARRTRARKAYGRAAACEGGFVPAEVAIASMLRADRHPVRAVSRLKVARACLAGREKGAPPECPLVALALAEVALGEGWYHEARRWAEDAERAGPRWRPVHDFWARYHAARGDPRRAAAAWRQALASDAADVAARRALARIHVGLGDGGAAISELRRALEAEPGALEVYLELARVELEAGRHPSAENTLRAALRTFPNSPEIRRRLGEVCLRRGDKEKALSEWDEALRLRADWHVIRRQAGALRGEPDDFSLPFALDADAAVAESKGADDCPRANTILVVDQTVVRIYADGSRSEITHQARKALTTEGVKELSELRVRGELLEARTRLPDGTVLEPAVLPGRGTLTMPGVAIGAIVEHRIRRDFPRPRGGFVRLPRWYFRGLEAPHQVSDYVVIAPAAMDLRVLARNWGSRFDGEEFVAHPPKEADGLKTWRWTARNVHPALPEEGHEHSCEILPNVLVARAQSWDDVNWECLDGFAGRTRLTRAIREEAAKVVATASKDDRHLDERSKTRALFSHVNGLVRAESRLIDASHVLAARSGRRVALLAALLRAAGLHAEFAHVRRRAEAIPPDQGPGEPIWDLPQRKYFSNALATVKLRSGERLWLIPSGRHAPFGKIPPTYHGGTAFIASRRGGILTTLPWGRLDEHGETTRASLTYQADGGRFLGVYSLVSTGCAGSAYMRMFDELEVSRRENWVEKRLSKRFGGALFQKMEMPEAKDPEAPFTLAAHFTLDASFDSSDEWVDVPTGVDPLSMTKGFIFVNEREYAQKIHSGLVRRDEVTVRIPGARDWALPPSFVRQTAFGSYNLVFTREGDEITLRREVTIMPQIVAPGRYGEFVRFCRDIDAAESAPLRARLHEKRE